MIIIDNVLLTWTFPLCRYSTRYQRVRCSWRTTTRSTRLYSRASTQSSPGWVTTPRAAGSTPFARCTVARRVTRPTPIWSPPSCHASSTSCASPARIIPTSCASSATWRLPRTDRTALDARTPTPTAMGPETIRPSGRTRRCSPRIRTSINSCTPGSCRWMRAWRGEKFLWDYTGFYATFCCLLLILPNVG